MFTRPDNSFIQSGILSSDIDNAELAARLSFNRTRRNGRVVCMDNFSSARTWESLDLGGGSYATKTVYSGVTDFYPLTSPAMLALSSMVAIKRLPYIGYGTMGFEIIYSPGPLTPSSLMTFNLLTPLGDFAVQHDMSNINPALSYMDSAGVYQLITNKVVWPNNWYNLKVVCDLDNRLYSQVFYGDDIYTLNVPARAAPVTNFYFSITAATALKFAFIDQIIITSEESVL
jgi:hypothetical protein